MLPDYALVLSFQNLAFRLMSRAGASVYYLISVRHLKFPLRLFLLLVDASMAEELLAEAEKPCLLDEFSQAFIARFKDVGLGSAEALASLRAIALVLRLDISDLESLHASLRRLLKATPQTKVMDERVLSAMWVGKSLAKRQSKSFEKGSKARLRPAIRRSRRGA